MDSVFSRVSLGLNKLDSKGISQKSAAIFLNKSDYADFRNFATEQMVSNVTYSNSDKSMMMNIPVYLNEELTKSYIGVEI